MAMIAITTSSSMSVKAVRRARDARKVGIGLPSSGPRIDNIRFGEYSRGEYPPTVI
jgi:hypothetical protein